MVNTVIFRLKLNRRRTAGTVAAPGTVNEEAVQRDCGGLVGRCSRCVSAGIMGWLLSRRYHVVACVVVVVVVVDCEEILVMYCGRWRRYGNMRMRGWSE